MEATTQECLEGMRRRAEEFDLKESDVSWTKEDLQNVYAYAKEISETLTFDEIALLYFIRACPRNGELSRFRRVAKMLAEAYGAFSDLTKPIFH